jgi:hypothetical protein
MVSKGTPVRYEIISGEYVFATVEKVDKAQTLAVVKVTGFSEGLSNNYVNVGMKWIVPVAKLETYIKISL